MEIMIGIVMGSRSDWHTMQHSVALLEQLRIGHEVRIVSAHRTPDLLFSYASQASQRGIHILIAGAGGAAHLPGMLAAKTHLPVLGVPIPSKALNGMDSLLSIVQMPMGVAVGTMAIGQAGAGNAAIFAASMLANQYPDIGQRLQDFRQRQTQQVIADPDPKCPPP